MEIILLFATCVIVLCIAGNKLSAKIGIPGLLVFLALGMIFGSDGLLKIPYENFQLSESICTVCLMFIMFCGGFSTNWSTAKPVAVRAAVLSSLGTIVTAVVTALGCHFLMGFEFKESFLIGAVISSTDAASVFSILRSKRLNLRGGLASLLEIESGSNDPFSYMLTVIGLALMSGDDIGALGLTAVLQIVLGVAFGVVIAFLAVTILKRANLSANGFDTIFMIAMIFAAYCVPTVLGGNGYLSIYIAGIIIGNSKIGNKAQLVHFFDGITGLCQILLFFLLGLLSFPSQIPTIILPALGIFAILTFVARPAAVFAICSKGYQWRDRLFVAWAGLRGASSIVFSIMATVSDVYKDNELYHIVLCVCLISVAFQGTLLSPLARKLKIIDENSSVLKTFNDYQDESSQFNMMRIYVAETHAWAGKTVSEATLPQDSLMLMLKRGEKTIIPKGDTVIKPGDDCVLSIPTYRDNGDVKLKEYLIDEKHLWRDKSIKELDLPTTLLIVMIKRGEETIVPNGNTVIQQGDIVVINDINTAEKKKEKVKKHNEHNG